MKVNAVSIPAQYMALFRAIETARPCDKRLFSDPFAAAFLSRELLWIMKAAPLPVVGDWLVRRIDRRRSGALSAGIARTRYIDEVLEKCMAQGAKQVIILGAGFDTRALRMDCLRGVPVYEFDLPDTALLKRRTLEMLPGGLPAHVHYFDADFNKQDLAQLLAANHIDNGLPTVVVWEGVTNYLTPASVNTIFRVLHTFKKGSYVIFTYINRQVVESPQLFEATDRLRERRNHRDEPWAFGFLPAELPHYLDLFDFTLVSDTGANEYRNTYMSDRAGLNIGYGFYRVALAVRK